MEIRVCSSRDVNEVYKLICELKGTEMKYETFQDIYINKLKEESNYYILAETEGSINGFLAINIDYKLHHEKKIGIVEDLVVANSIRGTGIGKALLEEGIRECKRRDCGLIALTSREKSERAHQFYEKNEFRRCSYEFIKNVG